MKTTELLERLKKGSIWSLVARVSASLTALLISMLLARLLPVESLGAYFLFLQILAFAAWFTKAGMRISLQKVLGIAAKNSDWSSVRKYLVIATGTLILTTLIFSGFMYLSWEWLTSTFLNVPALSTFLLLMLIAVPLRSIEELGSAFFCGLHLPKIGVFLADVPRQAILFIFFSAAFIILGSLELVVAINLFVIASLTSVIFCIILIIKWLYQHPVDIEQNQEIVNTKDYIYLSLPMLLQGGAGILMSASDIWILGIYTTTHEVGIYGAVVRLTMLLIFALSVVNLVIPPILAVLHERDDKAGLEKLMRTSAGWSIYIVFPVSLLFMVFGQEILIMAFGEAYEQGYAVLVILTIAHSVNALAGSPGMLLQMSGYQQLLMKLTLLWALISIVANIYVVRKYGMEGVAIVTGACIIGLNVCMVIWAWKILHVRTYARVPFLKYN